jgi:hypothetical protein
MAGEALLLFEPDGASFEVATFILPTHRRFPTFLKLAGRFLGKRDDALALFIGWNMKQSAAARNRLGSPGGWIKFCGAVSNEPKRARTKNLNPVVIA